MSDLVKLSVAQCAELLNSGKVSSVELCDAFIRQRVIEFADSNMSGIFFHIFLELETAKVRIFGKIRMISSPCFEFVWQE